MTRFQMFRALPGMLLPLLPHALLAQAASAALGGRIVDAETRRPVAGVVIQVVGANRFAESDTAGSFRMAVSTRS